MFSTADGLLVIAASGTETFLVSLSINQADGGSVQLIEKVCVV